MSADPIDELIQHHLEHEIDRGTVIRNLGAWRASTRKQLLTDEATMPGYIERSLYAIQVRKDGKRITYCSESRGTHATSYVYDPKGTCEPPAWWNRDAARAQHEQRRTA
jgi:hypothetical protein